jgi:hypothetical protein
MNEIYFTVRENNLARFYAVFVPRNITIGRPSLEQAKAFIGRAVELFASSSQELVYILCDLGAAKIRS